MNAEIHNNALELMKRDFLPKDWSKIGCQDPNRWGRTCKSNERGECIASDFDHTFVI